MKLELKSNRIVYAILPVVALAVAFWILLLSPKREEAAELGRQVQGLESTLAQHEAEVRQGEEDRSRFASDYRQLVVLGKAVPGDDDTASLLVEISHIAERAKVEFLDLRLNGGSGNEAPPPPPSSGEPASPTEVAASLLPLGARIGPAGLAVMPYTLTFKGSFFKIADFIREIDELVKTRSAQVAVDGRLLTLDAFSLAADPEAGFPTLEATFAVTTYLTPPDAGVLAEATPTEPGTTVATPASAGTGAAP